MAIYNRYKGCEKMNEKRITKVLKYIIDCWTTCELTAQSQVILRTIERILRGETDDS